MRSDLIHVEHYNGQPIRFQKGNAYVNLTSMCKGFPGRHPAEFIRLEETLEYIEALKKNMGVAHDLVNGQAYYSERGRTGGIWAHRLLALRCAYWCCKDLAIWCDQITLKRLSGEATFQPVTQSPVPSPQSSVIIDGSPKAGA